MHVALCGTVGLGLLLAWPMGATAAGPSSEEILDRMAGAYAGARTYRDSGVMRTTFITEDGRRRVTERRFKTAFIRPDKFRFEYAERTCCEDEGRYIIWMHGDAVRTWWEVTPGIETVLTLGHALGAAAGVSGGTSMTVPTLLLPDVAFGADAAGARSVVYREPSRLPDDVLEGVPCFRLQVRRYDEPTIMWIDQATYLIRRLDAPLTFKGFKTEETTVYSPMVDGDVDAALLNFGAPGEKGGLTRR